jgi:hypothetical protein
MKRSPLSNPDGVNLDDCTLAELEKERIRIAARLLGVTGTLGDAKKLNAIASQIATLRDAKITASKLQEEYRQKHP